MLKGAAKGPFFLYHMGDLIQNPSVMVSTPKFMV